MKASFLKGSDLRWLKGISNKPDATIFHHPIWMQLLSECYGYPSSVVALVMEDSENLVAGLPILQINSRLTGRRAVSLPFSDHCQPLVSGSASLDDLISCLNEWRHSLNIPEIVIHWPLSPSGGVYSQENFALHTTTLNSDVDQVFSCFKPKIRRFIHQAEKAEVHIQRGSTWDDMLTFYQLHLQTRKRQGVPIQPLRFFRLLWERVLSQGLGFVLLALQNNQPLAAAVFLHFNHTLTYKYGASEPAFWDLRPNHLVFWTAIQWGCDNGFTVFDWGRTDLDNEGLRDFKRSWGSEEQILHYSVLADHPPALELGGRRQQRLLAQIIQHSPAWVCRAIGELLYGHFS